MGNWQLKAKKTWTKIVKIIFQLNSREHENILIWVRQTTSTKVPLKFYFRVLRLLVDSIKVYWCCRLFSFFIIVTKKIFFFFHFFFFFLLEPEAWRQDLKSQENLILFRFFCSCSGKEGFRLCPKKKEIRASLLLSALFGTNKPLTLIWYSKHFKYFFLVVLQRQSESFLRLESWLYFILILLLVKIFIFHIFYTCKTTAYSMKDFEMYWIYNQHPNAEQQKKIVWKKSPSKWLIYAKLCKSISLFSSFRPSFSPPHEHLLTVSEE